MNIHWPTCSYIFCRYLLLLIATLEAFIKLNVYETLLSKCLTLLHLICVSGFLLKKKKKKVMKKNFHRPYNLVFVPFNFHDKDPYSPSELIPVPTESDLAHEVCMLILDTNKL